MDDGFFGGLFDFDHSGDMDAFERAAEFQFLSEIVFKEETDDLSDDERDLLYSADFDALDFDDF